MMVVVDGDGGRTIVMWQLGFDRFGSRFPGWRSRDEGQPNGEQEPGRRRRRWQRRRRRRLEATWPADHHKGETIGDPEDGLLVDPEAYQTHQGTVGEGDRSAYESYTGKRKFLSRDARSCFVR